MKILLVCSWNGYISGELTTIIDLYYNLLKYNISCELKIIVENKLLTNCIRHLKLNNNKNLQKNIIVDKKINTDLIICSALTIYNNYTNLNSKNLFILDTLDLVKNNYILPSFKNINVKLFSNPANINDKILFEQIEYYHKFSEERLKNLPKHYRASLHKLPDENFILDKYNYTRISKPHLEIKPGIFFENVGKRIFEHLYFNKIVNYSNDGLINPDGLFYYLKLFGIDGYLNYKPLVIPEQIIKEKLLMSPDDIFLKLVKEIA